MDKPWGGLHSAGSVEDEPCRALGYARRILDPSPFLQIDPAQWVASNDLAFAFPDPSSSVEGHTLVAPRRCVATWFEATAEEQHAIFALVAQIKDVLPPCQ